MEGVAEVTADGAFRHVRPHQPNLPLAVLAQAWPAKPMRLVVPYPPGSVTDAMARMLNEPFAKELGQPFVIDNRGGANGNVGGRPDEIYEPEPFDAETVAFR